MYLQEFQKREVYRIRGPRGQPDNSMDNTRTEIKKIGLLGGLSWVSTADYYRRLNELTQQRLGGVASARIVMESLNRQAYVDAVIERRDEAAAGEMIVQACTNLERAGAGFIVISCNDVHRFAPLIAARISVPIMHIAEVVAAAIARQGLQRVGLLGVMKTMESEFYPDILNQHGIETLLPTPTDREYIHDSIYSELVNNQFLDSARVKYIEVINRLQASGAQGVILGCTEIPLMLRAEDVPLPSFATTELHCVAAINHALESD